MQTFKIAVLISGRGSNLQALIDACKSPDFPAKISVVVSNKPEAAGLGRAVEAGIPAMIVDSAFFKGNKAGFEASLIQTLEQFEVDLICLAGFMRILSPEFLSHFQDRVINIHPSLLPEFKGLDTHARALEAGARKHGCSVHVVTPGMDEGEIILQKSLKILPNDTPDSLAERVLELEHEAYVQAIRAIALKHVTIQNSCVIRSKTHNAFITKLTRQPKNNREMRMPNTQEHSHSQPVTYPASAEAVQESQEMWNWFTRLATYAAIATTAVLVFIAFIIT